METVFIAMSGGFDSSFAAYLLKKQGYHVVGITFRLLPPSLRDDNNPRACCSIETVHRAQRAAAHLSIPHYVIDLREEFESAVIQPFIDGYQSGDTPNPCVLCNRFIKFSAFAERAFSIGADKIATGHYALVEERSGTHYLLKGTDRSKDQSYFLYPIKPDVLKKIIFPVGHYRKEELKKLAGDLKWDIRSLPESQDICFIPENNYRAFLAPHIQPKPGPIYLTDGTLLGKHGGLHLYTIGQRRGINIPYKEPLYIVDVRPEENSLVVGGKNELGRRIIHAREINILYHTQETVTAKIRYRQKEVPCTYTVHGDSMTVTFAEPISSPAAGQSIVLYHGDIVIGGGIITRNAASKG